MFFERPLSHDWVDIHDLSRLVTDKAVEVGFQFRAHPNLIALASQLKEAVRHRLLIYRLAMGHRLDAWQKPKTINKETKTETS